MRKITEQAINAFMNHKTFNSSNTTVSLNDDNSACLLLFGNLIARKYTDGDKEIEITNAGYATVTTKERLNGIPGVRIYQRKGEWFLNDKPWDGDWISI